MPPVLRFAISWVLVATVAGSTFAQGRLPLADLGINAQQFEVEIADTRTARETGLMYRRALPPQQGMLFVYPRSGAVCMWMKNTLIPLSVAFIDANGRILNIEDMRPYTLDAHCASASARYALEMNLGWFRNNGIQAGDTVKGLENLRGHDKN